MGCLMDEWQSLEYTVRPTVAGTDVYKLKDVL